MQSLAESFKQVVERRYSCRLFDPAAAFDAGAVERSLHLATLAANSSNLQLWQFVRVSSPAAKQLLADYCLGQKAARSSREMVVFATRRDLWRQRAKFMATALRNSFGPDLSPEQKHIVAYYEKLVPAIYTHDPFGILGAIKATGAALVGLVKPMYRQMFNADMDVVVHKSCALAAQTFMLGIAAEGYATCPMEGFDSSRVKRLLNLPRAAQITMVVAVGPSGEPAQPPRMRVPESAVVSVR